MRGGESISEALCAAASPASLHHNLACSACAHVRGAPEQRPGCRGSGSRTPVANRAARDPNATLDFGPVNAALRVAEAEPYPAGQGAGPTARAGHQALVPGPSVGGRRDLRGTPWPLGLLRAGRIKAFVLVPPRGVSRGAPCARRSCARWRGRARRGQRGPASAPIGGAALLCAPYRAQGRRGRMASGTDRRRPRKRDKTAGADGSNHQVGRRKGKGVADGPGLGRIPQSGVPDTRSGRVGGKALAHDSQRRRGWRFSS